MIKACLFKMIFFWFYKLRTDQMECIFLSYYAYRDNEQITVKYFNDFKELEFNYSTILEIKPKKQHILDDSLRILSVILKPKNKL